MLPLTLFEEAVFMLIRTLEETLKECQHVSDKVMSKLACFTKKPHNSVLEDLWSQSTQ